jgi:hypothetical protein
MRKGLSAGQTRDALRNRKVTHTQGDLHFPFSEVAATDQKQANILGIRRNGE